MPNEKPENVHIGLPENLKILWVADEFRTNDLSIVRIPGVPDFDVVVELQDKRAFGYTLIKHPYRYIRAFFQGTIQNHLSAAASGSGPVRRYIARFLSRQQQLGSRDFMKADRSTQIKLVKQVFSRVFVRGSEGDDGDSFAEVWNAMSSDDLPWAGSPSSETHDYLYDHRPLTTYNYYGESEGERYDLNPSAEDPVEKAERLYGIPDPRLVEN